MKVKRKNINRKEQSSKIKNLISFNNIKNPFKDSKESEQFFKRIIEEEMNLSNNYNSENLNTLLDLYLKGVNLYQNTPNIDKVNSFIEKSQLLLQSSKAKKVLNQNNTKTPEVNEIKTDSTLIDENDESDYSNKNKIEKTKDNKQYEIIYENNYNNKDHIDKVSENEDNDEEENDNYENKLKFDFKKYKTIKHNEIQNRNRLNYLSNSIKKGIKEKVNQKQKINEINTEINKIKEEQLRTSIFLEDEIKMQSNNFKKKLLRKRTMRLKSKNTKLKIDTIQEENIQNDNNIKNKEKYKNIINKKESKNYRNKTPNNNKQINVSFIKTNDIKKMIKRNSFNSSIKNNDIFNKFINNNNINNINENPKNYKNNLIENPKNNNDFDKMSIIDRLKLKINKYLEEFNYDIYKYYFSSKINNISDLSNKKYLKNKNIFEEYQIDIKDLLKKQINCNDKQEENNLEEDINTLKEEQEHEIQKNSDLYEKLIYDEISKFKLLGYSKCCPKELETLKNKERCDIYNEIYNILNK